ncbi:hypothetical protein [Actinokineospora cianjurensis]|uniref:Uncharacterized protein n=1 Tax=Actinokineospora cianjurensis TaxID=585224 RepID=A0A421AVQ6_9PSEU|nr:hypothetical protein [Actinokineospora cianjurensis]RLK53816.1 hypothetical protein CLV68_6480 [Actinokineospora cianjurensis]
MAEVCPKAERSQSTVRRLYRHTACGACLAVLVVAGHYLALGEHEGWLSWAQVWIATALVVDVVVRPVLRRVLPTRIVIDYSRNDAG